MFIKMGLARTKQVQNGTRPPKPGTLKRLYNGEARTERGRHPGASALTTRPRVRSSNRAEAL